MKPLLIIKVGDTFPEIADELGDFEHWVAAGIGPLRIPIEIVDPRKKAGLPNPAGIAGAVVTGSHAMVTDREPWSEALALWLSELVSLHVPVLGICYGHQLLAHALGGEVNYHPGGIEIGTVPIRLTAAAAEDILFSEMPAEFPAHVIHEQSVLRLPEGAIILAANGFEPHAAFRIGPSAWGVQYHPEFGCAAMSGYIRHDSEELSRGGHNVEALLAGVAPTESATRILILFGAFAAERMPPEFSRNC